MGNLGIIRLSAGRPPADVKAAEEFYRWLDEEHVPRLFKFGGLKKATNCTLIDVEKYRKEFQKENVEYPKAMTIFEFDSFKDLEAFEASPEKAFAKKCGLEKWGPDVGYTHIWWMAYEISKRWER
jgi:hypothetical protein